MAASSSTTLTIDQTTLAADGRLSMSGSCGQLLVYVIARPGRSVAAAHAVQKKKAVSVRRRAGSGDGGLGHRVGFAQARRARARRRRARRSERPVVRSREARSGRDRDAAVAAS
jgi:hypothetical protein